MFFMIGGKLMRLSLMLVKSLVFDFLRERERLCLVFPFFCFYSIFFDDTKRSEKIKCAQGKIFCAQKCARCERDRVHKLIF